MLIIKVVSITYWWLRDMPILKSKYYIKNLSVIVI